MPRNGSGSYSLPEAAFVPSTPISSTAVNSDFSDVADALTDSLSRTGDGAMLSELMLHPDGFAYSGDSDTGMKRYGVNANSIKAGGNDVVIVDVSGMAINGALNVSGTINQGGHPIRMIGEMVIWPSQTIPALWLRCAGQSVLRSAYPDLWAFAQAEIAAGNLLFTNGDGSTTFSLPIMSGRVPAARDNGAGRLTSATVSPNGDTLGAVGGAQTVTLDATQIPAHTHANSLTDPGHTHATDAQKQSGATSDVTAGSVLGTGTAATNTAASTGISITNASVGGGLSHINIPPTIIVNYIIYAGA